MIFSLCDFSAVIQLAATFNFGCIALSNKKSFAHSLSNYFFKVDDAIDQEFENVEYQITTDISSIDKMTPRKIEGKDIEKDVKNLKEELTSVDSKCKITLKKVKQTIENLYTPKYLDDLCIFLGFYSIYELILMAALNMYRPLIIMYFALNLLSLIVVVWFSIHEFLFYRKVLIKKNIDFQELISRKYTHKLTAIISIGVLILTVMLFFLNKIVLKIIPFYLWFNDLHFYIGLLLPFWGLFFYYLYVQYLAYKAHQYIKTSIQPIKEQFKVLHNKRNNIDAILTYFDMENIEDYEP